MSSGHRRQGLPKQRGLGCSLPHWVSASPTAEVRDRGPRSPFLLQVLHFQGCVGLPCLDTHSLETLPTGSRNRKLMLWA